MAHWNRRFFESTRGRIATLLRSGPRTVDELASELGLTRNAVRAHLLALESDGVVHKAGTRATTSKPSTQYALSADAERQYSTLYVPFLTHLLEALDDRMDRRAFDALMRNVGRSLLGAHPRPHGSIAQRVTATSNLLNSFGAVSRVENARRGYLIRNASCPLSAATEKHVEACNAMESLLSEFSGLPVAKCCERSKAMRCCFEIPAPRSGAASARRSSSRR